MAEQIEPAQKSFIISTIRRFFPGVEILAYGSRVKGSAQRYSDLDIALRASGPLDWKKLADLKEEFANSSLPFKVEPIDFGIISEDFQKIIEKTSVQW